MKRLVFAVLVAAALPAGADDPEPLVPLVLHHQGRLLTGGDTPADGAFHVTFSVYDLGADPPNTPHRDPLWTHEYEVQIYQGVYEVQLGDPAQGPALPVTVFAPRVRRWLAIQIRGEAEMTPRLLVASVPYAMVAARAFDLECEGCVEAADLAAGSVHGGTGGALAPGSISGEELAAGAVGTDELAAGAVTGDKIAAGTITGAKLAPGTLTASNIDRTGLDADKLDGMDSADFASAAHGEHVAFAGTGGDLGAAATEARSDHAHDAAYAPLAHGDHLVFGGTGGDLGDAAEAARADHLHDLVYAPLSHGSHVTFGGSSGLFGTAASVARSDHSHGSASAALAPTSLASGASLTFTHGLGTDTPVVQVWASRDGGPYQVTPLSSTSPYGTGADGDVTFNTGTRTIQYAYETLLGKGAGSYNPAAGRVPNYRNVTLTNGALLTVDPWDGSKGGDLRFFATGTVSVDATSSIDVAGKGYRGGDGTNQTFNCGWAGESYTGLGARNRSANGGGGGGSGPDSSCTGGNGSGGGGGGGYGTAGANGNNNATYNGWGTGGATYGDAALSTLYLGSGGGGAGKDDNNDGTYGGFGGRGGGVVVLTARAITVQGFIHADGATGGNTGCGGGSECGGGGGGSGGSVQLRAQTLTLGTARVTAAGGGGGAPNSFGGTGGVGGVGRIALEGSVGSSTTAPVAGSVAGAPGGAAQGDIVTVTIENVSANEVKITNTSGAAATIRAIALR